MRIFLISFVFLSVFASCKQKEEKTGKEIPFQLFQESVLTLIEYGDKISLAKDSMEVDSLEELYEKRITDINFSFPPDTDLKLSPQENDSLYKLILDINRKKAHKLESLSVIFNDTISDSSELKVN